VYKIVRGKESWEALFRRMEKAVIACPGRMKAKRVAVSVAMGLAKRSAKILCKENVGTDKCFVVKTSDPDAFVDCLDAASKEAGIVTVYCPPGAYEKGYAYRKLIRRYNDDAHLGRHGAVVVNGWAKPNGSHALVLLIDHPNAIEADGADPLEMA